MNRRLILAALTMLAVTWAINPVMAAAGKTHYVAIHVDENNPKKMSMALNNVQNIRSYYAAKDEKVVIEIVAYGPGLKMYLSDSPVKSRISAISLEAGDTVRFSACGNTYKRMSEKAGKKLTLLNEATIVPSGAVRLIELQEKGYSYLRP